MTSVRITSFAGLMPELQARNLPRINAQIAHNCLLWDGSLRPMPRWKKLRVLTAGTPDSYVYEDSRNGGLVNAFDYGKAVFLNGEPFAEGLVVGIDHAVHNVSGYRSNIYQSANYGDSSSAISYPAGVPTPTFVPYVIDGVTVDPYISGSSVGYIAQALSDKPVNRILGITFCRKLATGLQEGPMAVIPGQAPYGIMFEGDIVELSLTLDKARLDGEGITHIRLYRTISGLDSGEKAGNEFDTDWHLVDTIALAQVINYNDGGAATTDPLDLYLAEHFYPPAFEVEHFGLTEGGWFYGVAVDGRIMISERYLHYAWPTENQLNIQTEVTDAVEHFDNLYIGTHAAPFIAALAPGEGKQGLQAAATRFSERLPCLPGTMVRSPGGALYASPVGVVSLSKSGPQVVSAGLMNADEVLYKRYIPAVVGPPDYPAYWEEVRVPRTLKGAYYNGMYFGFTRSYQNVSPDSPISKFCYIYATGDSINGEKQFSQLVTMEAPSGVLSQALETRYGITLKYTNDIYYLPLPGVGGDREYRASPKECFQWKSKKFVFPGNITLAAGKVIHDCGGTVTVKLYVDCKCVWQIEVCDCEPFRVPSQIMGNVVEIELFGRSAVQEVHFASSMRELLEE